MIFPPLSLKCYKWHKVLLGIKTATQKMFWAQVETVHSAPWPCMVYMYITLNLLTWYWLYPTATRSLIFIPGQGVACNGLLFSYTGPLFSHQFKPWCAPVLIFLLRHKIPLTKKWNLTTSLVSISFIHDLATLEPGHSAYTPQVANQYSIWWLHQCNSHSYETLIVRPIDSGVIIFVLSWISPH